MIQVEYQDQIAIVSLNRPDKHNALVPAMLEQLDRALKDCAHKACAVVLVGEGKSFCAGFDLKMCADDPGGETMRSLLCGLSTVVRTMRAMEIPVVLGVHGAAVAGGCALLGGADIVVAHAQAKLGYPVVKIGVSPAVSAAFMMASIAAGPVRTRLLDTELISGHDALHIGLVHEIVEQHADLRKRTTEVAQMLTRKPGSGIQATKAWLNEITQSMTNNAQRGLEASLALTGLPEEQERLAKLWK